MKSSQNICPRILLFFFLMVASTFLHGVNVSPQIAYINQDLGPKLGYSEASGLKLLDIEGLYFKDLNRNGSLDVFEDWRIDPLKRARDLAAQLPVDAIAGVMLHSKNVNIDDAAINDKQRDLIVDKQMRYLVTNRVKDTITSAKWNNAAQSLVESLPFGIPVNRSSDPRHSAGRNSLFDASGGQDISIWPRTLGLAALFDPERVREFGRIASIEYRCMGFATALSPQIDLATEPRWSRFYMTFGESPELIRDIAEAYISGFQHSSPDSVIANGWGTESVNAMVKHWPGGGTGESGRDAHLGAGKYAVYPGRNFDEHLIPFTEGAFKLKDSTAQASAVMPYYTISYDQDPSGENVANGFSRYLINDLLRQKYDYDQLVCTDWNIHNAAASNFRHGGKAHGVETLSTEERFYEILMAGCDQFGGASEHEALMNAYEMGVHAHGEEWMRQRFERSAVRILLNSFRTGLFENPYLDIDEISSIAGNPAFIEAGYQAQLDSMVLLKNGQNVLPLDAKTKVCLVKADFYPRNFSGDGDPEPRWAIVPDIASKYFDLVDSLKEADVAVIQIDSPYNHQVTSGSDREDLGKGGNGYIPISLQYRPYVAENARERSIAYDVNEVRTRAYRGKVAKVKNTAQLDLILETRKAMKGKPVIVIIDMYNPTIVSEFEAEIDGLLVNFGSLDNAVCEILSGNAEPSGLLPFQLPANMETVETNMEDVPFDLECHIDTEGNVYDFGFGLDWGGPIKDERSQRYIRSE